MRLARRNILPLDVAQHLLPTLVAAFALVAAIVVVEIGWRDPGPGQGVEVPVPEALSPVVERLRSVPLTAIDDPRAASVASGVIFGRTDHVSPADEDAFLTSGLWHILTERQMARTLQSARD